MHGTRKIAKMEISKPSLEFFFITDEKSELMVDYLTDHKLDIESVQIQEESIIPNFHTRFVNIKIVFNNEQDYVLFKLVFGGNS